jgi:hypothetical protein
LARAEFPVLACSLIELCLLGGVPVVEFEYATTGFLASLLDRPADGKPLELELVFERSVMPVDRLPDRIASDPLRFERTEEAEFDLLIAFDEIRGADVPCSGERFGRIVEDEEERLEFVVELVERLGADE